MRRKGEAKPKKNYMLGSAEPFVDPGYYSDNEKAGRFNSHIETETGQVNADMSSQPGGLEKAATNIGTVGSAAAKVYRVIYSSCKNPSSNGVQLQGHMPQALQSSAESTMSPNNAAQVHQVVTVGNSCHLQQEEVTCSNQRQQKQFSPCCSHAYKPGEISCQCECLLQSAKLQSCQPQNGDLHMQPSVESTLNCSRPGIDCPAAPVTHNASCQQPAPMDPAQEPSSSEMRNTECKSQENTCDNQQGSSLSRPSPPPGTNNRSTDYNNSMRKPRGRGPTRCLELLGKGKRIMITTNTLGQPTGSKAPKLANFLGTLARYGHFLPLTYVDWRAVPNEIKEIAWQKVQRRFNIDPVSKGCVLKSLGKKWKDWKSTLKTSHYYPHETDEKRLADRDDRVLPDQWAHLIARWNSETEEARSAINKANRAQQKYRHATGTKSFARVREEQRAKRVDGKEPSRAELFIVTRTCRNGQPVDKPSAAAITQLRDLAKQYDTSQYSTNQDDIFPQVVGRDKHGRVRCYELDPSCSDLGNKKPTRAEALKIVSRTNVENRVIKEKLLTVEQNYAQMAAVNSTSSMLKFPDENGASVVANTSGASDHTFLLQEQTPRSCRGSTSQVRKRKRKN